MAISEFASANLVWTSAGNPRRGAELADRRVKSGQK
jgi:hypothetical protein